MVNRGKRLNLLGEKDPKLSEEGALLSEIGVRGCLEKSFFGFDFLGSTLYDDFSFLAKSFRLEVSLSE